MVAFEDRVYNIELHEDLTHFSLTLRNVRHMRLCSHWQIQNMNDIDVELMHSSAHFVVRLMHGQYLT